MRYNNKYIVIIIVKTPTPKWQNQCILSIVLLVIFSLISFQKVRTVLYPLGFLLNRYCAKHYSYNLEIKMQYAQAQTIQKIA